MVLGYYFTYFWGPGMPSKKKDAVHEVVCDGHSNVHVKCASSHTHQGKPRKDGSKKPYGHGWFMVVNPVDKRILWAKPMNKPEGNDILNEGLTAVVPSYENQNCVVVARACGFLPDVQNQKCWKQVNYWVVDKWHAYGHTKSCPCNPLYQRRLSRRIGKPNTPQPNRF